MADTEVDTSPFLVIRREDGEVIGWLLRDLKERARAGCDGAGEFDAGELRLAAKLKEAFGIEI